MANKKQYYNIGAGWIRDKDGRTYISCMANDKANDKGNVTLQAVNEHGEAVPIKSFVAFYNDKEKDNQPDVRFVFTLDD